MRLYRFVRDEIPYAFGPWGVRASQTLAQGTGTCTNKANLLVALLRAAGIGAAYGVLRVDTQHYFGPIGPDFLTRRGRSPRKRKGVTPIQAVPSKVSSGIRDGMTRRSLSIGTRQWADNRFSQVWAMSHRSSGRGHGRCDVSASVFRCERTTKRVRMPGRQAREDPPRMVGRVETKP
ncbi:MAG: transglutaminase-like domain-containing protein [Actinomycetota bacterium]|nr:transglutaminase-like domain-containing protein [Actinomycetota bacterium]